MFTTKRYADGIYVMRDGKKLSGPYNTVQIAQYAIEQHEKESR